MKIIIILIFLNASIGYAGQYHLIEPSKVAINAFQYDDYRDTYVAPDDELIAAGAIFTVNVALLKYKGYGLFWENELFFDQEGRSGQVRHGGWHYKLGATVLQYNGFKMNLYREHQSRHVFDETRPGKFPVYDRNGMEWILMEKNL
jgi:hypothetical protein